MSSDVTPADLLADAMRDSTLLNPMKIPFTFKWGGIEYTIPPMTAKVLPAYLSAHGGKHLAYFLKDHVEHAMEDKKDQSGKVVMGKYTTRSEIELYALQNLINQVSVEEATPLHAELNVDASELSPSEIMDGDVKDAVKKVKKGKAKPTEVASEEAPTPETEVPALEANNE